VLLAFQPGWLNPLGWPGMRWDVALHTTNSFLTNNDQQHYVSEQSLGSFAQLGALQFLFYLSAGSGLAVGFAVVRGLCGLPLGNFHRQLVRPLTRVLIPGSLLLAVLLLFCGVPTTLADPLKLTTLEGGSQVLIRGPVALFEAIQQLGENGGGSFGANSAHPFENPNGLTNLVSTWAMLAIPAASIDAFGRFLGNRRQGQGLEPRQGRSLSTAWVRLVTSSFCMIAWPWTRTVPRPIPSSPAISRLLRPRAIASSTSRSRGVSSARPAEASLADVSAGFAATSLSWRMAVVASASHQEAPRSTVRMASSRSSADTPLRT
jgi:K+-transporting ATPase A subunit